MAFNDCTIIHDGNDVSKTVISYEREKNICTGISTLTLTVEWKTSRTYTAWDEILLYEHGNKIGTFVVSTTSKNHTGDLVLTCQDYSKKLSDYFVPDLYEIPDFSYSRTWIEFFLELVGVDFSFSTSSNGNYINNNTVFGRQSAFDIIQSLLQMSGWYLYFDEDGTCIVGELTKDLTNYDFIFDDTEIQKLTINKHDKQLRNRAVVWGLVSDQEAKRVYADITVTTPWDTSPLDKRAVVLSNPYIRSSGVAKSLARKMLDTFAEITVEKIAVLVRNYHLDVGQVVLLDSNYFSGSGLVTTVQSSMSAEGGLISTIILDEKCPRLFGYFGYIVPVYVGTEGAGVWRKPLDSGLWENYSYGLFANIEDPSVPGVDINEVNPTEGIIPDLIIKNSIFACVNGVWAYRNIGHKVANWKPLDCGTLTDLNGISYTQAAVRAMAVDIDTSTNNIFVGYTLRSENVPIVGENRSWVVEFTSQGVRVAVNALSFGKDKQDFELVDVDKYKSSLDLAVAIAPTSYDNFWGDRKVSTQFSSEFPPDQETTCFGIMPTPGYTLGSEVVVQSGSVGAGFIGAGDYYGTNDLLVEGNSVISFGDHRQFQYVAFSGDTRFSVSTPVNFADYSFGWVTHPHLFRYVWREEVGDNYEVIDIAADSPTNRKLLHSSYTPLIYKYPVQLNNALVATTEPITMSGIQTIDGISLVAGNRVLVKNQTDPTENGVYTVLSNLWRRETDLDSDSDIKPGLFISVNSGNTNKYTCWQTDESTVGALGVVPLIFNEVLSYKDEFSLDLPYETTTDPFTTNSTTLKDILGTRGGVYLLDYFKSTTPYTYHTEYKCFVYNIESKTPFYVPIGEYDQATSQVYREANQPLYGIYESFSTRIRLMPCDQGVGFLFLLIDFREANRFAVYNDPSGSIYFNPSLITANAMGVVIDKEGNSIIHQTKIWDWWLPCKYNQYGFDNVLNSISGYSIQTWDYELYGFDTSKVVKPVLRFRARIDTSTYATDCALCGGLRGDRTTDIVYGTITLSSTGMELDNAFHVLGGQSRGYICYICTAFDWNAEALEAANFVFYDSSSYPLQSKLGLPKCVRKGKVQEYAFDDDPAGALTIPVNISRVSPIMDDIDNGIYIFSFEEKMIYKTTSTSLRLSGAPQIDVLAKFDVSPHIGGLFPWRASFNFFSGLFFFGASGKTHVIDYAIVKVKDDVILPGMKVCLLLQRTNENFFTVLDSNFFEFHTENSKDYPLTSFTNQRFLLSGYPIVFDPVYSGFTSFKQNVKIYPSLRNPSITYSGVHDTRIVDLGGSFYTDTDILDLEYARYMMTAGTDDGMRFVSADPLLDEDLEVFHVIASGVVPASGLAFRLETTNKQLSPYLFVTTSGDALAGIQSNFYQRNSYTQGWIDYSLGLPLPNVLTIRTDDLI